MPEKTEVEKLGEAGFGPEVTRRDFATWEAFEEFKDSSYLKLAAGESVCVFFDPLSPPSALKKEDFNGALRWRYVCDVQTPEGELKTFEFGGKFKKLLLPLVKKGQNFIRIKRVGEGTDTVYDPEPCESWKLLRTIPF